MTKRGPVQGQVERALVAADGTVTVQNCKAQLVSVDVADVDLLLKFADGSFVIIPNGALEALGDRPQRIIFTDEAGQEFDQHLFGTDRQPTLGDLFKLVGITDISSTGSLRVASEHLDTQQPQPNERVDESDSTPVETNPVEMIARLTSGIDLNEGSTTLSSQPLSAVPVDPVPPTILPRPSVYESGKSDNASQPIRQGMPVPEIHLDPITGDSVVNLAEAQSATVAITGRVAGDAQAGDRVILTLNGVVAEGFVNGDRTFSINVAGTDLAAATTLDATVTTLGTAGEGTGSASASYSVDLAGNTPVLTLNDLTLDNVINISEAAGEVAVTGSVSGAAVGDTVVLTINGHDYAGLVRPDSQFNISVAGSDLQGDALSGDSSIAASITTFDDAGNPGTAVVDKAFVADMLRPTAVINVDDAALKAGESCQVTIIFNEPVVDFSNDDLTIENGTLTTVTSSDGGATWIATLTPDAPVEDASNLIRVNNTGVTDLAGNTGAGDSFSNNYAIDTLLPQVTDVQVSQAMISDGDAGSSLHVTVSFSEAMDTAVTPALSFSEDVSGSLLPAGGSWNPAGTVYTATYTLADGGVDFENITIDVNAALDASGNAQVDYVAQPALTIDTLNPTVTISNDNLDGVVSATDSVVQYTLNFSEAVLAINASDLTITGGTLTSGPALTADGLSATVTVQATDESQSDLVVTVNSSVTDLNGNALVAATSTLPVDTLNPRVTISDNNLDGVVSDADSLVDYTLTFSKPVQAITAADLSINGGVLTTGPDLAPDGLSASFSVTAADGSTADLSVTVNGTVLDMSDRPLVPENHVLTVDTQNPTVSIQTDNIDGVVSANDQLVTFTLNFSEPVTSIDAADLTITGGTLTSNPVLAADGNSAVFSVTADNNTSRPLLVTVNNTISDLNGNLLDPATHSMTVNTRLPTGSAWITDTLITDADVGTTYNLVVNYFLGMDPTVYPEVIFSEDVSGSLVLISEGWSNRKFYQSFRVADANVDLSNITIDVIGGQDLGGNPSGGLTTPLIFSIDTLNPDVVITHDNLDGVVNDADNVVHYTLSFSEPVTAITATDLTVTGGWVSDGPVLASDGLSATFAVTAEDNSTANLDITINSSIVDLRGNALNPGSISLAVDTIDYAPDFNAALYTSSEHKVTGATGAPEGSYVAGASQFEQRIASSPAGQASRARIDGTAGDDLIDHNPAFSDGPTQWDKNLHLDFTVFDTLSSIVLVADPLSAGIPGFRIEGAGGVWDDVAKTWTLNPDTATSDALLLNGLDLHIRYDVTESGGPIDFDIAVNVSGVDAAVSYDLSKTLNFSWREATTEQDFNLSLAGNQVMVLPRDGLGMDIYAGDGNDTVNAGAGHDIIDGGAGDDIIDGGSGDDLLIGGAGADTLDGGSGSDTVSFADSVDGVVASLATGLGSGGDAAGDIYVNIENLIGGDGNDFLTGNSGSNLLDGGAGNDTLAGGGGLDFLNGGLGNDTISYADAAAGVYASLTSNSDADGAVFSGVENLIGSSFADVLIGDDGSNILTGGAGSDDLQGGGGIDTASYANADHGVIAALDSTLRNFQQGDAEGDTFSQIENLLGSGWNDVLYGNTADNSLAGGDGHDALYGGGGNDTLDGGAGDDFLHTGLGHDTALGGLGNDTILVSSDIANLPQAIDGGSGTDTLQLDDLASTGGTYDLTTLAGLDSRLEGLEVLDIREGSDPTRVDANTTIAITSQDILHMVDNGNVLTVLADNGDVLDLSAFAAAGESVATAASAPGYTEYVISDVGGEVARIQWHAA